MLKKVRSLFQSSLIQRSGIYTVSGIIEKAIPFFLMPVLTRFLTTEDYGIVSMFGVLVGVTAPFTGLGIIPAVLRSYYKKDIKFELYVSNAFYILLSSSLIVLSVFLTFSGFITKYTDFPSDWLFAVVAVSGSQFVINLVLVVWQAQESPIPYGAFKVSVAAFNTAISVFLIVALGYGWEGKVIGQLVAYLLFGILAISILWKNGFIHLQFVKKYIKHALQYGVPLIPHVLSTFVIALSDRIFITNMVGISETGIYTVGYQIGMIIGVLTASFNKAWTPWLYQRLNEGSLAIKRKIVSFTYLYFLLIVLLAVILAVLAPWFMNFLVGEQFYGATIYIIWIAIGFSFNGMYYMVTNYIFYKEKTHLLSWATFFAAGLNLVLNYFFILAYGAIGGAIATSITYLSQFLMTWYLATRVHDMPWLHFYKSTDS